jgi:hypothetical protein
VVGAYYNLCISLHTPRPPPPPPHRKPKRFSAASASISAPRCLCRAAHSLEQVQPGRWYLGELAELGALPEELSGCGRTGRGATGGRGRSRRGARGCAS